MFIDNLEIYIARMERSFEDNDHTAWDSAVHKLYGACAHFGATEMAEICNLAQTLSADETEEMARLHKKILKSHRAVHDLLALKRAA